MLLFFSLQIAPAAACISVALQRPLPVAGGVVGRDVHFNISSRAHGAAALLPQVLGLSRVSWAGPTWKGCHCNPAAVKASVRWAGSAGLGILGFLASEGPGGSALQLPLEKLRQDLLTV